MRYHRIVISDGNNLITREYLYIDLYIDNAIYAISIYDSGIFYCDEDCLEEAINELKRYCFDRYGWSNLPVSVNIC